MNYKKIILSLGSVAAVAAPITAVVSCGAPSSSEYSENDLLKMSNLKSAEAHAKLQNLWLAKVLINEYSLQGTTPLSLLDNFSNSNVVSKKGADKRYKQVSTVDKSKRYSTFHGSQFEDDFKTTLTWVLKNKLFASKDALSSLYTSLKTNAPDTLLNDSTGAQKYIVTNLSGKVFNRTDIDTKVNTIMGDPEWKNIFYNYSHEVDPTTNVDSITFNPSILGVKSLVLKMMVTKKYLSISEDEYTNSLPDEAFKVDAKFKDDTLVNTKAANYPLVVSAMNSRLAYKTSISLDASNSRQFIFSNIDNNLLDTDVDNVFNGDSSKFKDKLTYTINHQNVVKSIIAKSPSFVDIDKTIGFVGIDSLPSGDDTLDTSSVSKIKLAKDSTSRDGFIVDEKLLNKTDLVGTSKNETKIRFTDKDKTKVEINYYTSLMPYYDEKQRTLMFGTDIDVDILMNEAYAKDSSLFSSATKYFTEKENAVKIKVTNDWARNYYIDEGLTYIDDEKQ